LISIECASPAVPVCRDHDFELEFTYEVNIPSGVNGMDKVIRHHQQSVAKEEVFQMTIPVQKVNVYEMDIQRKPTSKESMLQIETEPHI
jgi:hypothetical protein